MKTKFWALPWMNRTRPVEELTDDYNTVAAITVCAPTKETPTWNASLVALTGDDTTTTAAVLWAYGVKTEPPHGDPAKLVELLVAHTLTRYTRISLTVDVAGNRAWNKILNTSTWTNTPTITAGTGELHRAYDTHLRRRRINTTTGHRAATAAAGKHLRNSGVISTGNILGDHVKNSDILPDPIAYTVGASYYVALRLWDIAPMRPPAPYDEYDYMMLRRTGRDQNWLCGQCGCVEDVCKPDRARAATAIAAHHKADPYDNGVAGLGLSPVIASPVAGGNVKPQHILDDMLGL